MRKENGQTVDSGRNGVCGQMMAFFNKVRRICCVFVVITLTVVIAFHFRITGLKDKAENTANNEYLNRLQAMQTDNVTWRNTSRWVVISIAVTPKMNTGYVFCIPIVVAAWKRIGWHSLIVVVGDVDDWSNSPLLKLVKQTTLEIDETARFFTIPVSHNPVSYAQVSRLFTVLLTNWIQPDDIIMTSDVDILPLMGQFYDTVAGSEIFVLNADCCSQFQWKNQEIRMQPMTSIGMSLKNWIHVMDLKPLKRNESFTEFVNEWLVTHYGKAISDRAVRKGENENWYLDQRVASIQLHYTDIKVNKIRRVTRSDRVDRIKFGSWRNFRQKVDAHMFLDSYREPEWAATFLLINDIFTQDSVNKLKQYKESFVHILNKNR